MKEDRRTNPNPDLSHHLKDGKKLSNNCHPPQFHFWLSKANEGAKSKAKAMCKNKDTCCKKVFIYGELAGSAWNPANWAFPGGWSETVNCSEVE